jgi:nicotinamidase-related amidase
MIPKGPEIEKSALIIVDMQNDFVHADGQFGMMAKQDPSWRRTRARNPEFIVEGNWGAAIIDELTPEGGEHLVVKKGYGGFANTPLDTILRNYGVTTCVVTGVTTCVCVSTTIRGGVENNYRMIIVGDGTAEIQRTAHEHELETMERIFADVKSTDEVIDWLAESTARAAR